IDFVIFGAFSIEVFDVLLEHHEKSMHAPALNRGGQFASHSVGKMIGAGSRAAMGGRPGDVYTAYGADDGATLSGMDMIFNHAEDSIILEETARAVHPEMVRNLRHMTQFTDAVGKSGANLFYCNGYTAPAHEDNDEVHGLCIQLLWLAKREHCEYGFCNAAWGYYIVTEPNTIWSFYGGDMHGTVLPSEEGLCDADLKVGPKTVKVSNGSHSSTPKRNVAQAWKFQEAREHQINLEDYWQNKYVK
ncbi:hypothetical protein FISHEDRAFT_44077, partial [Fistulina hepatica ATCC 64428]